MSLLDYIFTYTGFNRKDLLLAGETILLSALLGFVIGEL